jgi:hypothetical protein
MKRFLWPAVVVLMFTLPSAGQENKALANDATPAKSLSAYKLLFDFREVQGTKVINTRQYAMTLEDGKRGDLKIGSRVPVSLGPNSSSYIDIGVNLTASIQASGNLIALTTMVEVSSFANTDDEKTPAADHGGPVIRQVHTNFPTVLHEGQQSVIGSVDDVTSTKRYEIAVTATKMK